MKKIVASILTLSLSFVLAGNASAGKAQYWYLDSDGDGFGNPSISVYTNKPDFNYVLDNTDCNDDPTNGSNVYPGANEVVGDGIDQNCDYVDDCFQDNDLDTYGTDIVLVGTDLTCANSV